MKKILLAATLLSVVRIAALADAGALLFDTSRADIPSIELTDAAADKECVVRGGLPHFMAKIKA
ncbi:MAG: hypothetical protein K2K22_04525, partial [Muribaculaceae bacterium]|nr:hypothetical protein [Muribaculaceae bacterium]